MSTQNDAVRELAERIASDIGSRMPYKGAAEVAERIIREAIRPLLDITQDSMKLLAAIRVDYATTGLLEFRLRENENTLQTELARWKEPGR